MSLRDVLNRFQASIDELYNMAKRGGQAVGALENQAYANGPGTVPTDPTAASPIPVLAVKLTSRASGIFMASINMSATGLTATDTVETTISSNQGAAVTFSSATKVGVGTAGGTSSTTNGVYVSNAAGGIVFAGGGNVGNTQFDSGVQVQPTGGTTWQFSWSGIVQAGNPAAGRTPFTQGNDVYLFASVSRSAAAMTFVGIGASLIELP